MSDLAGNVADAASRNTVAATDVAVTVNQAAGQVDPTNSTTVNFTAVFSETPPGSGAVSGFTGSDVTITGTAGGTKTASVSGGPSTYNIAVSGITTWGTVTVTIPGGVATATSDGDPNAPSSSTDNTVTVDTPPGGATATAPSAKSLFAMVPRRLVPPTA